ncbi:MAG: (Fe-S)-binding protein [Desulfarculaceae bacterium]|nr:(Fe-S)-binding protein [Desulfarculaceae bacterium]MCF8073961.1 (Fe-S)-binding protein [Desulfarculaceae bacterium]MCF8102647.1 (Fe-S)-binding protein [Desulfarculaceae bacterium]MCF8116112.1 (Fe-S)-binding protein [Desulfarculaceae bacterium]
MAGVAQLARLLGELEEQLMACMRCGFCQSVCPLYGQTGREVDVARGKLALLDGLAAEILKDPHAVQERLERCLLCGSCAANCPSGVKVLDIFLKARAILSGYLGLSPAKKLVFRQLLARPALFNRLLGLAPRFERIFASPVDDLLDTSCARFFPPLGQRHFKRLARAPLHRTVPELHTSPGAAGIRVGFFTGCLIDKLFPSVGQAALKALDHHGVGVELPAEQACCGIPALSAGDSETFSKLLAHNLARFDPDKIDYLVTACATCASTLAKMWPLMCGGLDAAGQAKAAALAAKTRDVGQMLVETGLISGEAPSSDPGAKTLTYHDPCHLKKSLGVAEEPRRLIAANPGWRLVEMTESDWCCGMGGSFSLQHYDLSKQIGSRKREHIEQSGASTVATGCPACMLQISDMLSQAGDHIAVKHAIEIYAESL